MANPQPSIFTRFSNELFDAYITASRFLSPYENTVWLYILRRTYGFHKKIDWIAQKQIEERIGIKQPNVARTIAKLLLKNMVIKNGRKVGIQKDFEKWNIPKWVYNPAKQNISKQICNPAEQNISKQICEHIQTDIKNISKQIYTKETFKENTKEKEKGNSFFLKTKTKTQSKEAMRDVLTNLANSSSASETL